MTRLAAVLASLFWLVSALHDSPAHAHEVRPALLELAQTEPELWTLRWHVPARGDLRLGIYVRMPGTCVPTAPTQTRAQGGMLLESWQVRCAGGLAGGEITIDGLAQTATDVIVRVTRLEGGTQTSRVFPSGPTFTISPTPGTFGVARSYLELGIEHIGLGVDHLLFVLSLLILVAGRRKLVATITAFTLAHSLTLAAATLGWVRVPPAPVEAVIALSIVFLAREIVRAREGHASLAQRKPWLVAFAFGLLHGLGFAGALAQIGLPANAIPLALLFFNLGVELGQLAFIAVAGMLFVLARRHMPAADTWAWRLAAYGIGGVASYWTLSRIADFFV